MGFRILHSVVTALLMLIGFGGCQDKPPSYDGGLPYRGHAVRYRYDQGKLQYLIIFDRKDLLCSELSSEAGRDYGTTTDGHRITIDLLPDGKIRLGKESYSLEQGAVFLYGWQDDVVKTTQIPKTFQPHDVDFENLRNYVCEKLDELTSTDDKIAKFVGAAAGGSAGSD